MGESINPWTGAGELLGLADSEPAVVAVVGCGGKTTLIDSLASAYRHKKVLISPTTKIRARQAGADVVRTTMQECLTHEPIPGVQCLGLLNAELGKLEALPAAWLEAHVRDYDLVLLEADGSRMLPCKGWRSYEPVVPPYCTHTVGVVTLDALGKPADDETVLRLPEFLRLTGLREGEEITLQALTAMVCGADGMFRGAAGRQSILVNRVEDEAAVAVAQAWLRDIDRAWPGRFDCLACGSARANRFRRFDT